MADVPSAPWLAKPKTPAKNAPFETPFSGQSALRQAASSARSVIESLPALGDIPGMVGGAAGWVGGKLGETPEEAARTGQRWETGSRIFLDPAAKINALARYFGYAPEGQDVLPVSHVVPTTEDIRSVTDPLVSAVSPAAQEYTRKEPGNWQERSIDTTVQLLPALMGANKGNIGRTLITDVAAPAVGSEIAGETTRAYGGNETMARLIGAMLGGGAAPAGARAVTGGVEGGRQALVNTLMREGVDITAGQAGGRKALQYLEAGPFEGKARSIADIQQKQFNRAVLKRVGIDADNASPSVIEGARDTLGSKYDDLVTRSNGVPMDTQMENDLLAASGDYERLRGAAAPAIRNYLTRIVDAAHMNGGVIPPDMFKQIRSDVAADIRKLNMAGQAGDPLLRDALVDFQQSMFGSMERAGQPDLVAEWRDTNNKYRNLKIVERAMGGAGDATMAGDISPAKFRTAVERANPQDWVAGKGDFADLARAGTIMNPLPQSGTTPRALMGGSGLLAAAASMAHGGASALTDPTQLALMAGAVGAPWAAGSVLTSKPVRTALIRCRWSIRWWVRCWRGRSRTVSEGRADGVNRPPGRQSVCAETGTEDGLHRRADG